MVERQCLGDSPSRNLLSFPFRTQKNRIFIFRNLRPVIEVGISVVFKLFFFFFCWRTLFFPSPKESYYLYNSPKGKYTKKSNKDLVFWDGMKWREVYVGVQTPMAM